MNDVVNCSHVCWQEADVVAGTLELAAVLLASTPAVAACRPELAHVIAGSMPTAISLLPSILQAALQQDAWKASAAGVVSALCTLLGMCHDDPNVDVLQTRAACEHVCARYATLGLRRFFPGSL